MFYMVKTNLADINYINSYFMHSKHFCTQSSGIPVMEECTGKHTKAQCTYFGKLSRLHTRMFSRQVSIICILLHQRSKKQL